MSAGDRSGYPPWPPVKPVGHPAWNSGTAAASDTVLAYGCRMRQSCARHPTAGREVLTMQPARIALVGDWNPSVAAHVAIPKALEIAGSGTGNSVSFDWVATKTLPGQAGAVLTGFTALWCVPASPYESMAGALEAIRFARETGMPFLGTCGGYQHAVLEYARSVLGLAEADLAEVNSEATMPLIAPLKCALLEEEGEIDLRAGSYVSEIYGAGRITEKYHCSYGLNPRYVPLFDGGDLRISAVDLQGDPRAVELRSHRFFIGTAYQPERTALAN